MSWRIETWSTDDRRGTVRGKHLGPLEFAEGQTIVFDYRIGEEVLVDVEESAAGWQVTKVRPVSERQAPETFAPEFDGINKLRLADFIVQSYDGEVLTIVGANVL